MVPRLVVFALVGTGLVACARERQLSVPRECATLPQAPSWDPTTDAGVQTIIRYANGLVYEAADHPTGDRRPLTVILQRGPQPRGNRYHLANQPEAGGAAWAIAPQKCAHLFELTDLGPGGATAGIGEIAGYIESPRPYLKPPQGEQGPLPDCTLTPARCRVVIPEAERVFFWIDSLSGTTARGLLIPENAADPGAIVRVTVTYRSNPAGLPPRAFAEARWLFDAADDDAWVSCAKAGCCVLLLD